MADQKKRNTKGANKQIKQLQGNSATELGGSGVNKFQGFYNEEYKAELKWPESLKVYEKMMKGDAQIKASIRVCQLPIMSANWFVTDLNNDEDPQKKEAAEFLHKNLFEHKINFQQFLFEALGMLPYGFSLFELVFEAVDNALMWSKFAWRKQYSIKRWQMSDGQPGVVQQLTDSFKRVDIPAWKLLLFTNEREGDSEIGVSLLRSAYKHWYMKDNFYKIDAIAAERNGIGVLKIKLPANHKPEDMDNAKELGENFYANEQEYIILPNPEWEAEIMSGGTNLKDLDPSIKHHNREITKNVLAQFLELGTESSGSRALSEDHSSLFYLSLDSIAKNIASTLSVAGRELLKMNGFELEEYPKVDYSHIGMQDVAQMSKALLDFINAGLIEPDDELEDYVRNVMQLPNKMPQEDADGNPVEKQPRKNKSQETDSARQALLDLPTPKKDKPEDKKADPKKEQKQAKASEQGDQFNEGDIFKSLTPEHKQKISEALKRYWAGIKKTAVPDAKADTPERKLPSIPKPRKLPSVPKQVAEPSTPAETKESLKKATKEAESLVEHMEKMLRAMAKIIDLIADTGLEDAIDTIKKYAKLVADNKELVKKNLEKMAKEMKKEEPDPEVPKSSWGMINNINEHNRRIQEAMDELNFSEPVYVDDLLEPNSAFSELNTALGGIERVGSFREYNPSRDLYPSEGKVHWQKYNDFFNETEADFGDNSKQILDGMIEGALARGEKALNSNKLADIGKLAIGGVVAYKALIKSNYKKSYDFGKTQAADELNVLAPKTPAKRITQMNLTADALVDRQMADMELVAKTTLLDGVARNLSVKETLFNTKLALNKKAEILNRANVGISVIGQVTQARQDVFQDNLEKIELFQYSAILDGNTTNWCASLDGRTVEADSPEFEMYRPGQHFNCRSMWVAIGYEERYKPQPEPISGAIPKQDGGPGNFKDLKSSKEYTPKPQTK